MFLCLGHKLSKISSDALKAHKEATLKAKKEHIKQVIPLQDIDRRSEMAKQAKEVPKLANRRDKKKEVRAKKEPFRIKESLAPFLFCTMPLIKDEARR